MAKLSNAKSKVTKKEDESAVENSVEVTEETVQEENVDETTEDSSDGLQEDSLKEPSLDDVLPKVEVTADIDSSKIPEPKNVRVKMRRDFSFTYGGAMYDFKKGQCYNVPPDVRKHMNKYNVLMPLL